MTLRALFTQDHKRLQSLATALKHVKTNRSQNPTAENRIKGEILRCLPYLEDRLGRRPLKSELKAFIINMAACVGDTVSDHKTQWSQAFRNLRYPADSKKHRIDEALILKLAKEAADGTS